MNVTLSVGDGDGAVVKEWTDRKREVLGVALASYPEKMTAILPSSFAQVAKEVGLCFQYRIQSYTLNPPEATELMCELQTRLPLLREYIAQWNKSFQQLKARGCTTEKPGTAAVFDRANPDAEAFLIRGLSWIPRGPHETALFFDAYEELQNMARLSMATRKPLEIEMNSCLTSV